MAIWPFGRKNRSKSPSTPDEQTMAASKSTTTSPDAVRRNADRQGSDRSVPTLERLSTRKDSQKRARSSSRRLSKSNMPSYRNSEKAETVPPIPALPEEHRKQLNEKSGANKLNQQPINSPQHRYDVPQYYLQNPLSVSSLQPEKFTMSHHVPTLQGKRSANDGNLPRNKSSKRKANDHAREQEIKAMSSPMPIPKRPVSHQTGLLARDSKQIRDGMRRNGERPMSDVSLPMQESMQSQLSLSPDQHSFKVSAFAALSPRPTIRYSGNPRSPGGSNQPSRSSTRKEKQPMIPEETMQSMNTKSIADLADDMDSPSLRELMDRDRRRHETRQRSEYEKLQRRLEQKAAKQREQEVQVEEAAGKHPYVGEVPEPSAAPTFADAPEAAPKEEDTGRRTPESWLHDPSHEHLAAEDPFHDSVRGGSTSHLAPATPTDDRDEPVLGTAKAVRLSSASMSPPTSPTRHLHGPSSLSQLSALDPLELPATVDPDRRRDSDNSTSNRFSSNWKSIFRRSETRTKRESIDRGRFTPSEFSNTSRDSIAAQMPPSAFTRIPRAQSGTPVRTQSRFREDLPELPFSPPDSKMPSSEASRMLPNIPGSRGNDTASGPDPAVQRLSDIHPAYRDEIALSRNTSLRATSPQLADTNLSRSLASVDSEGSWLTGKPVKRSSGPMSRDSAGSLAQQLRDLRGPEDRDVEDEEEGDEEEAEEEPPGTPEAEKYMGTLTPAPDTKPPVPHRRRPHISGLTDDIGPDSSFHSGPALNVAEQEGTWHGPIGKHPTVVNQGPGPRAKSREGLLNDFQMGETSAESSPSGDSPVSPEDNNPFKNTIQRATSVDLGKGHARHISAGSARLLNLPPRSSTEIKRFSASSGERSPLSTTALRVPEDDGDSVD